MNKKNRVGLGTFPLANVFDHISTKDAETVVRRFLDEGGYYIDTAPQYGFGAVEELLGRALRNVPRDSFYLCTKGVKFIDENKNVVKSGKYEDVIRECDKSLQRLGLDYVDLFMVHSPDKNVPVSETLGAMEELQKQGKAREIAVSNVSLDELKEYNKTGKIRYVQNRFSLINRSLSPEFERYLLDKKIYLIPYHLLEIGQLTGIAFENYKLREGDLREQLPYWNQENQEVIFSWVREHLAPIAKKLGITIGQLNIAWALHQRFIDFVIIGTTKLEYLSINLNANKIVLPEKILTALEESYNGLLQKIKEKYHKDIKEFRGLDKKITLVVDGKTL